MAHDHDTGYKLLFSSPEMVGDLLRGFVPHEWVKEADFASLRRVNGSYVSEDLRTRHDDMVWKIRLRDQWLYVYLLVDERRLAGSDAPLRNLAAALFRLEAASEPEDFRAVTAQLVEWLSGERHERLRRTFAIWLSRRLRHRVPEANIPETDDLAQVHGMFPDNIIATAEKRGLEDGRQKGRQEGRQEGEAAALTRLLTHRFGELPSDIHARIECAALTEIIAWFDRAIDAADLDGVVRTD